MGATFGCAASRVILSNVGNVAMKVEVRTN